MTGGLEDVVNFDQFWENCDEKVAKIEEELIFGLLG